MAENILVVGGGPAGLHSAVTLANIGVNVSLVERDSFLGGNPKKFKYKFLFPDMQPADDVIGELIKRAEENDGIKVYYSSNVSNFKENEKKFNVTIKSPDASETKTFDSVIIATGFEHFDPARDAKYSYQLFDDVIDIKDLERMMGENNFVRPSNGQPPKNVAFILCVGSRDRHVGNQYCSRVCCTVSVKQAIELRERFPDCDAYIFYMDIRTYGFFEDLYWKAMEEHDVQIVKGRIAEITSGPNNTVICKGEDTLLRGPFEIPFDMVVLASGMEGGPQSSEMVDKIGLELNEHGFLKPQNVTLAPFKSNKEGVFLAGACTGPKAISDSIVEGGAAAMDAYIYAVKNK
ncbi:CoB--CoM heterodisulfide reductase iron-sulfur subunit A family protein [Candidatus Acidulodesulfobacterium sp. H_13]|uniref:CoB--CoM heterodisulfide reductase iron-sulfur subunit A family protein n=1 Tax=Candidatus Acidulodesulfobacterium sp. H_13 TaxID=3395470 RepID=UPI003AF9981A